MNSRLFLNWREFGSDCLLEERVPCLETVLPVNVQLSEGKFYEPFLKTLSDAIKQKLEDEPELGLFATKTPGSGRTRRGESFLRLAASPDTTPTVTPSQGWDCGTRSGSRPGKTGFLSHSLLTEQHTCPRVSHEKNLWRFSVQGEAEERKQTL